MSLKRLPWDVWLDILPSMLISLIFIVKRSSFMRPLTVFVVLCMCTAKKSVLISIFVLLPSKISLKLDKDVKILF